MNDFRTVICGGGIAAVEALLRLRKLLGDSATIELIAPNEELVYRPLAVRQPFAGGPPPRYPLGRIARDCGVVWHRDKLAWVDRAARVVHTEQGESIEYDALLIAVGARSIDPYEHVRTFSDSEADATFHGIVQDIEGGYARSLAFILPAGPTWPLPIYELALMSAERAAGMGIDDLDITLVTSEARPLAIFGERAAGAIAERLERAGITVYAAALAHVAGPHELIVQPQGVQLRPERIVAMPRIEGPGVAGLPGGGAHGFVPIDRRCCVPGTDDRIYAAGDATDYPIKHGALGAQMADTAAAAIAGLAGADAQPKRFYPVIHGAVLTGGDPLFISARLVGSSGFESEVHETPPWPEDEKVVAEELGPYLATLEALSPHTGRAG